MEYSKNKRINNFLLLFITLCIIIIPTIDAAVFIPQGDIYGVDYYRIYGFTTINATNIYQNGNAVYDTSSLINASSIACGNITGATSDLCTITSSSDTKWSLDDTWIYNNSGEASFNTTSGDARYLTTGYTSLSNFTNDPGYFDNIANFTGSIYGTKWCRYNGTSGEIDCDVTAFANTNTNIIDDNLYNTTQLVEQADGKLGIVNSWITTFVNSWFGTLTTDNLTEGNSNLYDNSSWNETHANTLYLDIDYTSLNNFTNDPGYFDDIANFTGTLTDTKYCIYTTGTGIVCNSDAGVDTKWSIDNTWIYNNSGDLSFNTTSGDSRYYTQTSADSTFVNITGDTMTGALEMSSNPITGIEYIDWNLTATPSNQEGRTYWDTDMRTLAINMAGGEVTLQVGTETLIYVKNKAGYDITNGQAVTITGASGNTPTIAWADNRYTSSSHVVGIATEDIDDNANGFITVRGLINGIDTSGTPVGETWLEGDSLYLDEGGNLSNQHPSTAIGSTIIVATVIRPHATVGQLLISDISSYTLGNNYNGILRSTIRNENEGEYAGSAFTAINDLNHYVTFGIASSNNTIFNNEVSILYAPGYGDQWQAIDGNKDFVWFSDPTDSHNNSALDNEIMRLYASGNLNVTGNITAESFIGDLTGTADTTTAFESNPTDCSAGYAPQTIDASGNFGSCTQYLQSETYVGTVTSIATTGPIAGGTITDTGTISLTACGNSEGYVYNTTSSAFECTALGSGTGSVTSVATDDIYLTGGPITGSGTITLNETKLNATIAELDVDTTYSAGNGMSLSVTTFSVAGNTALTQDSDGLSVTNDAIGDTQLEFNTGQHLTTTSNPTFNNLTITDCITFASGGMICSGS